VPQRFLTTVPQQALYLMNSPFVLEEAHHVASRREIDSAQTPEAHVNALYHLIFGRAATADEVKMALGYVQAEENQPQTTAPPVWQNGLSVINAQGQVEDFHPLKCFVEQKWQPASITPQPVFGEAELDAKGGVPTSDPSKAVTRRWISPVAGIVEISGTLTHKVEQSPEAYRTQMSDGVRARIILNHRAKLAEQSVNNGKSDVVAHEVNVKPGDVIDFTLDCVKDSENDSFQWAPVITLNRAGEKPQVWDAGKQFEGPRPRTLNAWEKYAQVLLQTNEFAFVD
jgi:hypothetical protein